eukprot:symbB.v1.2.013223.t1/scaffold930.1/size151240/2
MQPSHPRVLLSNPLIRFPGGRSYDGLWANTSFEHLGVHPALVNSLEAQDIVRPTVARGTRWHWGCKQRPFSLSFVGGM